MKTALLFTFLVFFMGLLACQEKQSQEKQSEKSTIVQVEPSGFQYGLEQQPSALLLDVRTPKEFSQGHLKNAQNINFHDEDFAVQLSKLAKDKAVYVYCKKGGRSANACKELSQLGFKEIYDLQGGYMAWQKAGLTTVLEN